MSKKLSAKTKKWRYSLICVFSIFSISFSTAQNVTVSGTVTDADDGATIPGVSILIKGTSRGTTTDSDGTYKIEVPESSELTFSFVGYNTQTVAVLGRSIVNVALQINSEQLDEVIVIGYGTQKKALVTGANLQVDGDELVNQSRTNALESLQGKTAGVEITSTSGQPGSPLNVVIRGKGSTGGNNPLYVVDGVFTGDISYLNNADIESITVLKDAASAAIYGSQASNGVVLVTTKNGRKNSSRVTFDQYYGTQTVHKKIDMLNAREYAIIMNEATINQGRAPLFTNSQINNLDTDTNWMDRMFVDNVVTQNYNIGFSGGGETSIYSSSFSYTQQGGVVGGEDLSNYERYNARINSSNEMLNGFLTIGENLTFAYTKSNGIAVGNQYNNSLRPAFNVPPLVPFSDADGNYYNTAGDSEPWLAGFANPFATMEINNQNENNVQKLVGNVYAELKMLSNLKFRTNFGIDYSASESRSFQPIYQLSSFSFREFDRVFQSQSKGFSTIWSNLLTYQFNIQEDHQFEALLGTEAYSLQGSYLFAGNANMIFNTLEYAWLNNTTNTTGTPLMSVGGGPFDVNRRMSYFGRLNYNYKNKYLVNTTLRADGSSNFSRGNRWGYFPSVSAGWVLSEEDFLGKSSTMSFLKVRASWGQVGNQNAAAFQYLAPITTANTNYSFGDEEGVLTPGAFPNRLANPLLKWETSEQINVGIDARFLRNALSVNLDLYQKTNKDWIIVAPVLATAGANPPFINGGDVTNRGIELALNYSNSIGDVQYNIGVNGAFNRNRVGNIPTADGIIHGATNQLFDNSPEFYRAQSGFPLGYFWGLKSDGIFQNQAEIEAHAVDGRLIQPNARPGDVRFIDQNGDGIINDADKVNVGDPNPDFTFGMNVSMNYKGFDLIISANGVAGNQIVQSYRNQANQFANHTSAVLDRWVGEGTSNTIPRVTLDNRNYANFSDLFVQNGDFLRINNVTLGYDLSTLAKNLKIEKFRVFASGLNLFTFTKYNGMDPEVGYGISTDNYNFSSGVDLGYYPRPRTMLLGLNVIF